MIDRILNKIFSLVSDIKWGAYYRVCRKRGLILGKNVTLHQGIDFGSEPYLIEIGDNTRIAKNVSFINHSGGQMLLRKVQGYEDVRVFGRIKIDENCFIGANSLITHGVFIGANSIIAAGSVVNNSVPKNCVYGGIPAKFICNINEYYERKKKENVLYPRELEKDRKKLDEYIKHNLPRTYKKIK